MRSKGKPSDSGTHAEECEPSSAPVNLNDISDSDIENSIHSGIFSLPKTVALAEGIQSVQPTEEDLFAQELDAGSVWEVVEARETGSVEQPPPVGPETKRPRYSVVDVRDSSSKQVQTSGSAFSSLSVPAHLVKDAISVTDRKQFLYPWEKGRMGKFFEASTSLVLPCLPKLQPGRFNFVDVQLQVGDDASVSGALSLEQEVLKGTIYANIVKARVGTTYLEERESKRTAALKGWRELLSGSWDMSDPGMITLAECPDGDRNAYCEDVLDACFGVKAPNTLLKRMYTIKAYNEWIGEVDGKHWLPLTERDVWLYLCMLRETKAPSTKATSFIEAIRFVHFMFRASGAEEVLDSQRLKGRASQLFANKKPWRPAEPLSVAEVLEFHKAMNDVQRDITDRIICGHLLHMLYSRSRFSDLLAAQDVVLDTEGLFLELHAKVHKGARNADSRSRLLPVVAPAKGIDGKHWAAEYFKLRAEAGLVTPAEDALPMLPAPKKGSAGMWHERYLSSPELNAFMREFFKTIGISLEGKRLTSHSLKATGLNWSAKFGVDSETRAILVRHATAVQGPTALYSRDVISAAMRVFIEVINKIRLQWFCPDRSRGGMMTPPPFTPNPIETGKPVPSTPGALDPTAWAREARMPLAGMHEPLENIEEVADIVPTPTTPAASPAPDVVKLECMHDWVEWPEGVIDADGQLNLKASWHEQSDLDEDDESESESSDSSSSTETQEEPMFGPQPMPERRWYINCKSLVLHCLKSPTHFRCGRLCTQTYVVAAELNGLRCGRYFPDAE